MKKQIDQNTPVAKAHQLENRPDFLCQFVLLHHLFRRSSSVRKTVQIKINQAAVAGLAPHFSLNQVRADPEHISGEAAGVAWFPAHDLCQGGGHDVLNEFRLPFPAEFSTHSKSQAAAEVAVKVARGIFVPTTQSR